MSRVTVSEATLDDWERLRALRLAALSDTPDAFTSTLEEERERPEECWRGRLERTGTTTLIATLTDPDGEVRDAGLAVVAPSGGPPDEAGLYSVWVAPWARGHGVGAALLDAAIRVASVGHRRMVLDVGDHNEEAIRLYERFGFEPTGRSSSLPAPREDVSEHERARDLP